MKPRSWLVYTQRRSNSERHRVQELCESRGGRPGLSILMNFTVSVDVKQHRTVLRYWSQFVPNMSTDIRGREALHHHHHSERLKFHRNWVQVKDSCDSVSSLWSVLLEHCYFQTHRRTCKSTQRPWLFLLTSLCAVLLEHCYFQTHRRTCKSTHRHWLFSSCPPAVVYQRCVSC